MKTKQLIVCAFFAALTAVLAQIVIPIGAVPISLATFSVFCAGALLGAKLGAISQLVYVLLGLAGAPVFAMFRGGYEVLTGPTGGYLTGYIIAAWIVGFIADKHGDKLFGLTAAMISGFAVYMAAGTCWYMFVTKSGLAGALMMCVVPFLPGDAAKIAAAATLALRLRPVLQSRLYFQPQHAGQSR